MTGTPKDERERKGGEKLAAQNHHGGFDDKPKKKPWCRTIWGLPSTKKGRGRKNGNSPRPRRGMVSPTKIAKDSSTFNAELQVGEKKELNPKGWAKKGRRVRGRPNGTPAVR